VTVDKSSVKGASEPIVTYGKKQSTSVAWSQFVSWNKYKNYHIN
jgi:hypothetical protein